MFIGHYGPAYAIKRWQPRIPLFILFAAVQFLDVLWSVFVLAGVERVRIVPGITATNPLDLYYMPYTHSLIGALFWSVAAGALYVAVGRRGSLRPGSARSGANAVAGAAVGIAVFSHWLCDLVVHAPDLPLYDNAVKVGFGLWNYKWPAFGLEIALLLGGLTLYLGGTRAVDRTGRLLPWGFTLVLVGIHASVFFGSPPGSPAEAALIALGAYAIFAAIAAWMDHHRAR